MPRLGACCRAHSLLRLLCAHSSPKWPAEAAALRANNAALAEELDAAHAALAELGVEQRAAVVAAEAGTLCAEAEVAKARDAAGHMMALAGQIQAMFQLCEVGGRVGTGGKWLAGSKMGPAGSNGIATQQPQSPESAVN